MTFPLTPDKFSKLEAELLASHQVLLTAKDTVSGAMTSLDGKIAADFDFDIEQGTLTVNLTKHDGYPAFLANAGLKSKLSAAIKAL
jgi:hypothetical protein